MVVCDVMYGVVKIVYEYGFFYNIYRWLVKYGLYDYLILVELVFL